MAKLIKVSCIGVIALSMLMVAGGAMALTDEERLQKLEDKFLNGEISEDIYRELREKYHKKLGTKETTLSVSSETTEVQLSPKNIVQNPSFEDANPNDQSEPFWWGSSVWYTKAGQPTFVWDDKVAHSGKKSVSIECKPGSSGVWIHHFHKSKGLENFFQADKFYQMSTWVKAENLAGGSGIILDGCEVMGERPWVRTSGTHDWKKLVIKGARLKQDSGTVSATLVCRGGKVWFDDVELVEMEE